MRRLETQELLESRWVLSDGRPRRYYKLTAASARTLKDLTAEWRLIERYVYEVARHLPLKTATDVGIELHSLLSDSLEQRAAATGCPPVARIR